MIPILTEVWLAMVLTVKIGIELQAQSQFFKFPRTIVYSIFSQVSLALSLDHLFCINFIIKVAK